MPQSSARLRVLDPSATTRLAGSTRRRASPERLFWSQQIVASSETGLEYRVERLLGQGGYGQVYLAHRLGGSTSVPRIVCLKVSARIDGWLREAYFGQLLDDHPRAIRVYDTFPFPEPSGRVLYVLTLEYA